MSARTNAEGCAKCATGACNEIHEHECEETAGERMRRAVLLYQTGIANVFDASTANLRRILQADFRSCEAFAAGLIAAGVKVEVWSCNVAGDALTQRETWRPGVTATPFRDETRPPKVA